MCPARGRGQHRGRGLGTGGRLPSNSFLSTARDAGAAWLGSRGEAPMSVPFSSTNVRLPNGFENLLEGLVKEVLRAQPKDVVGFAAQHFQTLLEQRKASSADPAQEDQDLIQPPLQVGCPSLSLLVPPCPLCPAGEIGVPGAQEGSCVTPVVTVRAARTQNEAF
nr:sperm surface protein Sp17 [Columba livia]